MGAGFAEGQGERIAVVMKGGFGVGVRVGAGFAEGRGERIAVVMKGGFGVGVRDPSMLRCTPDDGGGSS